MGSTPIWSNHAKTPAAYRTVGICQAWATDPQLSNSLWGSTRMHEYGIPH
jgi:hypothetical protein